MSNRFESLKTDGYEVKLKITSVIYEKSIPAAVLENEELLAEYEDEELSLDDDIGEEGPGRTEQTVIAVCSDEKGRVTITYDDSEILELPDTLTQITFAETNPESVSIVRSGALKSMITVEEGKRNMGEYRLGPYSIPVGFYGKRVRNTVKNGEGEIELDYIVEMNGSDTSRTKMKIVVSKCDTLSFTE